MKILMTGSTGYVGSHLLPLLIHRGHEVLALVRPGSLNQPATVGAIMFEIPDDQEILRDEVHRFNPQICLHLASHLTSADDFDNLEKLLSANIQFTCRILDVLKDLSLKLFINTGTFAEYYCGNEELDPAYLYAATKSAARSFVRYYASAYHFKAATVVPYTIYGGTVEQKKIIDLIFESLGATTEVDLTPGEQVLDFIHIRDVVEFYGLLIDEYESVVDDTNFYLGTGHGHTLRQLTEIMQDMTGQRANIKWGGRPYRERDTFYSVANISLQYRMWKWKPLISLRDGLLKYLNEREYAA